MDKEKRIKEMAKDIGDSIMFDDFDFEMHEKTKIIAKRAAEKMAVKGYRKQKEGEWISNELGGYKYAFYCSECGWVDGYPFNDRHKYCPNCGAKMKGV